MVTGSPEKRSLPLLCTSYEELLPMALLRAQEQTEALPPMAPPPGERREISQLGLIGTLMVQGPARRPGVVPARS